MGAFAHCTPHGKRVEIAQTRIHVNQFLQIRRGPRQVTRLILLLLVGFTANLPRATFAHDLFTAYVQHSVRLSVNASHIDLTLDLTFFEEWSAKERLAMDTDSDGRISRREMDVYVKKLAPQIAKQVKVRVAERELSLAPLYEPEIDLLGNDQTGPAHHRLRIFFFAMTPAQLHAGDQIVIEDSLWPKTP